MLDFRQLGGHLTLQLMFRRRPSCDKGHWPLSSFNLTVASREQALSKQLFDHNY